MKFKIENELSNENEIENEIENEMNNEIPNTSSSQQEFGRSKRIRIPNRKYMDYNVNYITIEDDGGTKLEIDNAIKEELYQMEIKKVFQPVYEHEITKKAIPCRMFVKKKLDSTGNLIKWKARLVAGGHRQVKDEDFNTSSPTANKTNIFLTAGIAAQEERIVATADVKGAFLNADMSSDVFMTLGKEISKLIIEINPTYQRYRNSKGLIVVKLLKALYGCVESARLWYEEIANYIQLIGFEKSVNDQCLFYKLENDSTTTHVIIYVDDLFITASKLEYIKYIENELIRKYKEINFNYGKVHEYLGMEINFNDKGTVSFSMKKKIIDLLNEFNISKSVTTPATNNLFICRDKVKLDTIEQDKLRSGVAKLLYLSINTRPDIQLPVNYLCGRANKFDEDDKNKFIRVLQYLYGTVNQSLTLNIGKGNPVLTMYVDAAYAIRTEDRQSQSGMIIKLGNATILSKSIKQKIVTKSSTEAELVAVSDFISYLIYIMRILEEINYNISKIILFQDNTSTINLINNQRPTSQRTLHIDTRYFFVRQRQQLHNFSIQHIPTDKMVADLLTKPLQGAKFNTLKGEIMGV